MAAMSSPTSGGDRPLGLPTARRPFSPANEKTPRPGLPGRKPLPAARCRLAASGNRENAPGSADLHLRSPGTAPWRTWRSALPGHHSQGSSRPWPIPQPGGTLPSNQQSPIVPWGLGAYLHKSTPRYRVFPTGNFALERSKWARLGPGTPAGYPAYYFLVLDRQ